MKKLKPAKIFVPFAVLVILAAACGSGNAEESLVTTTTVKPVGINNLIINQAEDGENDVSGAPPTVTTLREVPPPPVTPYWETRRILTAKERPVQSNGISPKITIPVYDAPNGQLKDIPDGSPTDPNYWGSTLVFMVTEGEPGDEWAEVLISSRPNGLTGWVRTNQFEWSVTNYHITVDLSDDTVTIWEGNELVSHSLAITGRPLAPTPLVENTYIEAKVRNVGSSFKDQNGTWIFPLALYSETLEEFGDSLPKVAIHGTNVPEFLGRELSSGCVRIPNDAINILAESIPIGTAVRIVA